MTHLVVVGSSIAGATAAGALRSGGFAGDISLIGEEAPQPYSRVPLSKGVLAGTETLESATLAALPDDVNLVLGSAATSLDVEGRSVQLADGVVMPYDGVIIATGARARRLARKGQAGEHVIRTLDDAAAIAARIPMARSAIVVGAGFLGMEVGSTLRSRGLDVTLVDREPPLRRLLGQWLSDYLIKTADEAGIRFHITPGDVELLGNPISGVAFRDGRKLEADVVVCAAGDLPNVEWLADSGLHIAGGLVVDARCLAAPRVAGAGDVTSREVKPGVFRRTPHWSNAVTQGRAAAAVLLDPAVPPYQPDHYFWTEQFGIDLKIAGELPLAGQPEIIDGDPASGSAVLRWHHDGQPVAAASINFRLPVVKLKRLAAPATGTAAR
ncbi:ferredoxin reductase [Kribbella qitaiheensis]|uniref:Ferredoxin reductase n=1 Tax=Kribbella qitaiheensis TaxID=1544730 RepID=A0A7G6X532_9ACTN|nr:FAD-dependent oxidoreductase [Kribbella qitaiheensis]QNE21347.1 ferredoxin reductase [Kribbella qitaiheensis]